MQGKRNFGENKLNETTTNRLCCSFESLMMFCFIRRFKDMVKWDIFEEGLNLLFPFLLSRNINILTILFHGNSRVLFGPLMITLFDILKAFTYSYCQFAVTFSVVVSIYLKLICSHNYALLQRCGQFVPKLIHMCFFGSKIQIWNSHLLVVHL